MEKERNYWLILIIIVIITVITVLSIDAQEYKEIKGKSVRTFIIIDSINFACTRSQNGYYYIEQSSKGNHWYRKFVGKYTETMYQGYKVFTGTKNKKYWYWTVDEKNKLHKHKLQLE